MFIDWESMYRNLMPGQPQVASGPHAGPGPISNYDWSNLPSRAIPHLCENKNKLFKIIKHAAVLKFMLLDFCPYGSWEVGDSLRILSWGVGTISTIENVILITYIFYMFGDV